MVATFLEDMIWYILLNTVVWHTMPYIRTMCKLLNRNFLSFPMENVLTSSPSIRQQFHHLRLATENINTDLFSQFCVRARSPYHHTHKKKIQNDWSSCIAFHPWRFMSCRVFFSHFFCLSIIRAIIYSASGSYYYTAATSYITHTSLNRNRVFVSVAQPSSMASIARNV